MTSTQTTFDRPARLPEAVPVPPSRRWPALRPDTPTRGADRPAELAARFGRTGLAPFITSTDATPVGLCGQSAATAYVRRRRWAITAGDVISPPALAGPALDEYLHVLAGRRLRPAFVAVEDPRPYRQRAFALSPIADEAVLDLPTFDLRGPARAGIRHAVACARRAGLTVACYSPALDEQLAVVSREWLQSKRGGERGFTLSRQQDVHDQLRQGHTDLWATCDPDGVVQAWCTWRHYQGGEARVLDIMRRRRHAPNATMDFLLTTTLQRYQEQGVRTASLASVPREHGALTERIYPCRSLRAYKQKFDPRWEPRWLAVPTAWQRPIALAAICSAYSPAGLRHALTRNH